MDTFDKDKAERRKARQAKIDEQMKAMESAMGAADQTYRNFMTDLEKAEDEVASTSSSPNASFHRRSSARSIGESSLSEASGDEHSDSQGRRSNALDMARSFLHDEDGHDVEFEHADASGRGEGALLERVRSQAGPQAKQAVESVNSLVGQASQSFQRAVGGVTARVGHREEGHSLNGPPGAAFREDNLHNLSSGLENYDDPRSSMRSSVSFTNRSKFDQRSAHLRDDDEEKEGVFSRLNWACVKCAVKMEDMCLSRRCLLVLSIVTIGVALVVALASTTSVFSGELPSFNFGGKSTEEIEAENERYLKIRDRILFAEASQPQTLESERATPQSFALEWIAKVDPRQMDPEDPFLLQRYALAVLWFQLRSDDNGKPSAQTEWKNEDSWLSEKGYCAWFGVECYPEDGNPKNRMYDGNNIIVGLNLTKNELKGVGLPNEIYTACDGLQTLDVSHNKLGGTIGSGISKLTALEGLYIGDNEMQGTVASEIGQLGRLMNFYAHNNLFTGQLPSEIGNLENLYALGLHENKLSGTIPSSIGKCQKLRLLYMDQNSLEGSIPNEIYGLSRLADLRLRSNRLKGSISDEVSNLSNLELLYLDSNELTGTIPRGFGALASRLEILHLQDNELEGDLEVELGRLTSLKELYLSSNKLKSTIPVEWKDLKDLRQLFLSENYVSGTIPIELTQMQFLVALQLQSNSLKGTIPTELGSMFRLEYLHLESNQLEGNVPTELGQLLHLQKLTLQGNPNLTGKVPDEICELSFTNSLGELVADCSLDCSCCTDCV